MSKVSSRASKERNLERVQEILGPMEYDEEIPAHKRAGIAEALDLLYETTTQKVAKGAPPNRIRHSEANDVHFLVEHYGATVKSAVLAVLPKGDPRAEALARCYQQMKAANRFADSSCLRGAYGERIKKLAAKTRPRKTPK